MPNAARKGNQAGPYHDLSFQPPPLNEFPNAPVTVALKKSNGRLGRSDEVRFDESHDFGPKTFVPVARQNVQDQQDVLPRVHERAGCILALDLKKKQSSVSGYAD